MAHDEQPHDPAQPDPAPTAPARTQAPLPQTLTAAAEARAWRDSLALGEPAAEPAAPVDAAVPSSTPAPAPQGEPDGSQLGGVQIGKRYVTEADDVELLATKPGKGTLAIDGVALRLRDAKPLPASD